MIPNVEKCEWSKTLATRAKSEGSEANIRKWWRYLAIKKLSSLLKGITSKYHGDFYCLYCLHSLPTEKKLSCIKDWCENKDFCIAIMPSKDTKILDFNHDQKSDKVPFVIYADLDCIKKRLMDVKIILKIHLQQK